MKPHGEAGEALLPFALLDVDGRAIPEAFAAVAELIEAARRAAIASVRGDGNCPGTIRNADLDALRAALVRVQGGAA